jgi:segregation and condensation protein B
MDIRPIGGEIWKRAGRRSGRGGGSREFVELRGAIEAMLFVSDEPLPVRRISEITGSDPETVEEALRDLEEELRTDERGIQLRRVGEGWRLYTNPDHAEPVSRLLQGERRGRLTRAALETLAIIAYMQPITRTQIAAIRGVQSETVVKVLEGYGLVREEGKEASPGGPALYVTTPRFLEQFGLTSLDDLPPLESFEPDRETAEKIRRSLGGAGGTLEPQEGVDETAGAGGPETGFPAVEGPVDAFPGEEVAGQGDGDAGPESL